MLHDISPQMSGLVSFWCSTLLYGVYVVIFFSCLTIMINNGSKGASTPKILYVSTTLQFLLSTAYIACGLRMLIDSFINLATNPEAVLGYWLSANSPTQVTSKAIYLTNTLIGDAILVWRLYVVWNNNLFICIIPTMMVLATTGIGYFALAQLVTESDPGSLFRIVNMLLVVWGLSIATQFCVSFAIAGRILWMARKLPSIYGNRYFSIVWIIVESGALYCITTVLLLVFFDLKTQAGGIIGSILAQICAIVPTLIIVRVGLHRAYSPSTVKPPKLSSLPIKMDCTNSTGSTETNIGSMKGTPAGMTQNGSTCVRIDQESWIAAKSEV